MLLCICQGSHTCRTWSLTSFYWKGTIRPHNDTAVTIVVQSQTIAGRSHLLQVFDLSLILPAHEGRGQTFLCNAERPKFCVTVIDVPNKRKLDTQSTRKGFNVKRFSSARKLNLSNTQSQNKLKQEHAIRWGITASRKCFHIVCRFREDRVLTLH